MRDLTIIILYLLLICLFFKEVKSTEEGATLSNQDLANYRDCADKLNAQVGDMSSVAGFAAILIPPTIPTEVHTELIVIQVHEISEEQVFSITAMVSFNWKDERLALINDSQCENSSAQFTVLTTRSLVWYPQWTISNGHGNVLLKDAWQFNPAILFADGTVLWKFSFNFLTECPLNVQQFPFDVQQCAIDITSPFYDTQSMKFVYEHHESVKAETEKSLSSPLWRLIGYRITEVTSQFPSISFRFLLQRRPGSYTVALILPIIVVNIITGYTFLLPAYQGEKTTSAGATTTAYLIFYDMFFQYVPMNSDLPGLIVFMVLHNFISVTVYLVECRLIRFYEDKAEEEKHHRHKTSAKKGNKVAPSDLLFEEEIKTKKGPFDGISPDYINDWCLIGYVAVVLLSYVVFFIYLPVAAQVYRDQLLSTTFSTIPVEVAETGHASSTHKK